MKKILNNKIAASVGIATGILCLSMSTASASVVVTLNNSEVDGWDRYVHDNHTEAGGEQGDGTGDFLSAPQNETLGFPGRLAGSSSNRRQLWDFDLPEMPGATLTAATLTFRLGNITDGSPDFSILGSLLGDESTRTIGSYEDANYSTSIGSFADGDDNTTVNLDVLAFIQANYDADGGDSWASFRIQSDDVSGADHNAQLGGFANTTQGLQLQLTFVVPEPSTIGLLGMGGLMVCFLRRRRMRVAA